MRNRLYFIVFIVFISFIFYPVNAQKFSTYSSSNVSKVEIAASILNVRSGAGQNFKSISTVKKGEVLDVLGSLDDWYVVHLPDNSIGVISGEYVIEYDDENNFIQASNNLDESNNQFLDNDLILKGDIAVLFNLTNKERLKYGLPALLADREIMNAAQLKADDMAINNYLSHNSKALGSPFTMLKRLGIVYKAAGENIAANNSVERAHNQLINSKNHLSNIVSPRFKKMGIGIAENEKYGKVIVQLFVE